MTLSMIIRTLFEFILFSAVVWGTFNEDKLVAFEQKVFRRLKRRKLKVVRTSGQTYNTGI